MPVYLTLIYAFSAFSTLVLGIFGFRQQPRASGNRAFLMYSVTTFLWIATLYLGFYFGYKAAPDPAISTMFNRFAYGFGILMIPTIILFFYYFPKITFRPHALFRYLFFGGVLFFALMSMFTGMVEQSEVYENGKYLSDTLGPLYDYYSYFAVLMLLVGVFIPVKKIMQATGIEKKKVLIAAAGCWAFIFITMMTNVILPIFNIYAIGPVSTSDVSPLYALLFILPTFYSIHHYRFIHFSSGSLNWLRRIILAGLFFIITFGAYQLMDFFLPGTEGLVLNTLSSFIGLYGVVKLDKIIPELITESMREFRRALTEVRTSVYAADTYEKLRKIIDEAFLIRLNFLNAKVVIVRENKLPGETIPVHIKDAFTKEITGLKDDALIKEEIRFRHLSPGVKAALQTAMEKMEADLCLPLFSEKNLIGLFVLKKKEQDSAYSHEEIDEFLNACKALEVALMNILLKMNLQEENNLMKTIINQKTKGLVKRIEEIKELLGQQKDFMAVTAHEFRTPLTVAMFQMQEILRKRQQKPSVMMEDLKVVDTSLGNLKSLTQKLFSVQQYDLNKVELKPEKIDWNAWIKAVYKDFTPVMKEKKIRLKLENHLKGKTPGMVDPTQMRQLFTNLLNNSQKFTPEKGQITIGIEKQKKNLLLTVSDTGQGVPDELKQSIFDKFKTSGAGHGIGLGLYLCKKIAELHKGKIWVEDAPGGGARFCVQVSL